MAYWGLMLVACAVFYWMNVLTPLKEDDMLHSLVIGDLTPVDSLGDLLHSWHNKFFITNGRTADMVAELFCGLLGKPLFNVCNALMFGLLAHVVSLLATRRRSLLAQGMLYACIGTCYPVPGETMLWLAGSCNYLWSITASLWLLYYLLHHHTSRLGWPRAVLLLLVAMLAGAGNEAMSFGLLGGMVLYFACNRRLIDRTVAIALVGYMLGVLLIVASPAAWERASGGGIAVDMPLADLLMSRCYIVGERMVRLVVPVMALAVGAGVLLWRGKGFRALKTSVWPYVLVMLIAVLLILGLMPYRPYAPLTTVSLIVVILAADTLLRRWPLLRLAVVACCVAAGGYAFARGVADLKRYKAIDDRVVSEIRAASGQAVLIEVPDAGVGRFVYPLPLQSSHFFSNEYIWRAYFNKENIQFVSDSVYVRFHEGRLLDGAVAMPFTADRTDVARRVLAFADQDYMVLELNLDTLPTAYQVGTAFREQALSAAEQAYRRKHAIAGGTDPFGYYPLRYRGQALMVLPLLGNEVSRAELLLDYAGDERLMLTRVAPNPPEVKTDHSER